MSIILANLSKRFNTTQVVSNVSLEIKDGVLFVLLGGSGSGKSTILRMIAGLSQPDTGSISLNGRDVTNLPPQKRGTGFVFQNYSIFKHMTVADNIAFGLRIRRLPVKEQMQRTDELLELVGLSGLGKRFASQLSGGQQQRVALARALAYKPEVLLLDEPFGALDVKIRSQLRKSLRDIQKQLKVTTVLVTHDQEEAFELADQIGVIERGHLVEVGTPEQLYHTPHKEFTATFIGGGNVLAGRKKGQQIRMGKAILPFPPDSPAHEEDTPVRILFRPETVVLQSQPFTPGQGVYSLGKASVIDQTFIGSLRKVTVAAEELRGVRSLTPGPSYGEAATQIAVLQTSQADTSQALQAGEEVYVGVRNFHVLDPSGLKILVYTEPTPAGAAALEFGCRLAQAAGGPTTILEIARNAEDVAAARGRQDVTWQNLHTQIPLLDSRTHAGSEEDIYLDAVEGDYELVIWGQDPGSAGDRHLARARSLLLSWGIPVMIVHTPPEKLERILICTAAGEPGKSDVVFGGRVARLTGAQATVYHIYRPEAGPAERQRVQQHIKRAITTLEQLGVSATDKLEDGPVLESILKEADTGKNDLIVIGAPAPLAPARLVSTGLVDLLIQRTPRAVLIVPMGR